MRLSLDLDVGWRGLPFDQPLVDPAAEDLGRCVDWQELCLTH